MFLFFHDENDTIEKQRLMVLEQMNKGPTSSTGVDRGKRMEARTYMKR